MSTVTIPQILTHHELRLREIEEKIESIDDIKTTVSSINNDVYDQRISSLEVMFDNFKRDITTQMNQFRIEFQDAKKIQMDIEETENTEATTSE